MAAERIDTSFAGAYRRALEEAYGLTDEDESLPYSSQRRRKGKMPIDFQGQSIDNGGNPIMQGVRDGS